jgi:exopolysaccharide/PEP-CTERM locus tyrosine autokinase
MTMAEKNIRPGSGSLIERASQVYGLREAMRQPEQEAAIAPLVQVGSPAPAPLIKISSPATKPAGQARSQSNAGPVAQVDLAALREAGFVVPGAPPSSLSEEFRIIKRQLLINAFGGRNSPPLEKGRMVLICSAQPNEGKTFSSVNLALSMASESDNEVLLVDADVAKPEVLSTLGIAGGAGLMDVLADPSLDIESLIVPTSVPGLSVLPAGRQINNDTELLASAHTAGLIDGLVSRYPRRIVLFDSAPALAASPASVLALHVGQILLVVRADQTTESELRDALAMLEGDAHVQLMINSVTYGGSTRKFGYYYGFGE